MFDWVMNWLLADPIDAATMKLKREVESAHAMIDSLAEKLLLAEMERDALLDSDRSLRALVRALRDCNRDLDERLTTGEGKDANDQDTADE